MAEIKPIAVMSTDWHLKPSNLEDIKELTRQEICVAKDMGINTHIWLGDIFDSRISQRQETLDTLTEIIEMYEEEGQKIICIPGNHDKTSYDSEKSFLDVYKYHPNFDLIDMFDFREVNGVHCYFLPFFDNEIWLDEISNQSIERPGHSVLFSHIAMQGSRNNDGSEVESEIKPSLFKDWGKVFLGHYHDHQELTKNVIHLGSITQNNFGEDDRKGFWILYEDLSYNLIPSDGKRYKKEVVNLDEMTFKQVDKVIKALKENNPDDYVRVEIVGSQDQLKSIDKKVYQELGIDVKLKAKELEVAEIEVAEEVKALSNSDIAVKFKDWCKENDYNYEEGYNILKQVL